MNAAVAGEEVTVLIGQNRNIEAERLDAASDLLDLPVAMGSRVARVKLYEQVLWPEFRELSAALSAYLAEITEKLIREEVHGETADAEEREEPRRLNR